MRGVDADELPPRARRVRQRAEQVEERAQSQRVAHRRDVAHGRVVPRREEEADAALVDAGCDALRRKLDLDAQRGKHVGAAAARGDGAVAVLGHPRARRRGDEGGGGGDVEGVRQVAAGAAGVDQPLVAHLHPPRAVAQGERGAGDLIGGLALHSQRDQEGRDQRVGRAAFEDPVDRLHHFVAREVLSFDRAADRILEVHARTSRKLRSSVWPSGVRMDSGWNCTPKTGSVRWRSAITVPSLVRALTASSRGKDFSSTTSEW
jgi:hypothetical protein